MTEPADCTVGEPTWGDVLYIEAERDQLMLSAAELRRQANAMMAAATQLDCVALKWKTRIIGPDKIAAEAARQARERSGK